MVKSELWDRITNGGNSSVGKDSMSYKYWEVEELHVSTTIKDIKPARLDIVMRNQDESTKKETNRSYPKKYTENSQKKGKRITKNSDEAWNQKLQELAQYKSEKGDCLVPKKYENQSLVRWIKNQRYEYTLRQRGKKSRMSDARMKKLKSVGFAWRTKEMWMDEKWKRKFDEMKAYKRQHGDCLVPKNYADNPSLSHWVQRQRKQYKLRQNGQPTSMTEASTHMLNSIGFLWQIPRGKKDTERAKEVNKGNFGDTSIREERETSQGQESNYMLVGGRKAAPPQQARQSTIGNYLDQMKPTTISTRRLLLNTTVDAPQPARFCSNPLLDDKKWNHYGSKRYQKEVEQYLRTWYGVGLNR